MKPTVKYFRNKTEIQACEPDSLFKLQNSNLVLVDDDQYISVKMDDYPDTFYEVPDPFPKS